MRFKSTAVAGYKAFAVTGINSISFAIDFEKADTKGLLGFAVERNDITEKDRRFFNGFKVFKELIPKPTIDTAVSTLNHPIQSFVWDDFSAKPDRNYEYFFYPMKGVPGNLVRAKKGIKIKVKTEPLFTDKEHDVFFNRGAASSRAFVAKFGNQSPHFLKEPKKSEALAWLSRDLSAAMFNFIAQAKSGDALRCCFYEFSYLPVLQALKKAMDNGVDVQLILDMKKAPSGPSTPRDETLKKLKEAGIPDSAVIARTANPDNIMHNKFMIYLSGNPQQSKAVWTGSTNITFGGIHGHTNVGHWIRNEKAAAKYLEYWGLLKGDPGALASDNKEAQKKKHAELQQEVEQIQLPISAADFAKIPVGTTTQFSPMKDLTTLRLYAEMLDKSKSFACITFPFGINKTMTDVFLDNMADSPLVFMLFDTEPKGLALSEKNNVYPVWGVDTDNILAEFAGDTAARTKLKLNTHVEFVHTKIILMDPLSAVPVVVSGSANFTNASTTLNDENMVIVKGDKRAADIFFTEFNRVFNHFYLGMAIKNLKEEDRISGASMFLDTTDSWLKKYEPGSMRHKRVKAFVEMGI
jgi:phosphatidylserine/phosphatidylglycerophosphate/cardiolipin synthase-like enzyme